MSRSVTTDEAMARAKLESLRWGNTPTCPFCRAEGKAERIVTAGALPGSWRCLACRRPFRVTTGTVFDRSPLPLTTWLTAVRRLRRPNASPLETADALGIDDDTASTIAKLVARAEPRGKSFDGLLRALLALPPAAHLDPPAAD